MCIPYLQEKHVYERVYLLCRRRKERARDVTSPLQLPLANLKMAISHYPMTGTKFQRHRAEKMLEIRGNKQVTLRKLRGFVIWEGAAVCIYISSQLISIFD